MTYQIPWDEEKGQPWTGWPSRAEPVMRDNFTFTATLHFEAIYWREQSSVIWTDAWGATYTMFITDFEKMLLTGKTISNRFVSGRWTFIKRGNQYGLRDTEAAK